MLFTRIVRFGLLVILATLPTTAKAQIVPDGSLPTNINQLREIIKINGRERAGDNLFHSFDKFSIPEGIKAIFENALDIKNIFTRITGSEASNLDGLLKTQGSANLFLINPNGVIFGENAQLDIAGSFIATTGNSIQFEDKTEFTVSTKEKPILTISIPTGVQFNGNSGAISINGTGSQHEINNFIKSPVSIVNNDKGLVTSNNTIALIGSNIDINGGIVSSTNGNIEVVSIGRGNINFQWIEEKLDFNYDNVGKFQNITLGNRSLLNNSDDGKISLTGANVELGEQSLILIQNHDSDSLGSININASKSLVVKDTNSDLAATFSGLRTETRGKGNSANIYVSAKNLMLEDGGSIVALTFGQGESGDISLSATDSFEIKGVFQATTNSSVIAATNADGNSGNIRVFTEELLATDGSVISSTSFGTGGGGNVWITANRIELSGIGSNTIPTGITTNSLNTGKSGNITIETSELILNEGATVNSTSLSGSGAGNVFIDASNSIDISGRKLNFLSTISSSIVTINEDIQNIFMVPKVINGNSGNVTINTSQLNIDQSGSVSVKNERIGSAGTIFVTAEEINLSKNGRVNATSNSGIGGNINLKTNKLQLDENSVISASAGEDGNGGNITINSDTLFGKENSNITANAVGGNGGNITINTSGLFFFPDSTIEASSELGIDGTIEINTVEDSLQQDLQPFELKLTTDAELFANSCLVKQNKQQGSFTIFNSSAVFHRPGIDFFNSQPLTGLDEKINYSHDTKLLEIAPQPLNNLIPGDKIIKTNDGRVLLVASQQPQSAKSLMCN